MQHRETKGIVPLNNCRENYGREGKELRAAEWRSKDHEKSCYYRDGYRFPLGNDLQATLASLKSTTSGITYQPEYEEMGLRSHIAGSIDIDQDAFIDRKLKRFMGDAAAFSYIAMQEAINDSGLESSDVSNEMTGIIAGSGGASSSNLTESADVLRERGLKRVGPYRVTRTMSSTISACLATAYSIQGVNYSITSACATSAHCIGSALEQIQLGKQDIVFAGGGEEEHWSMTSLFDAMGALSTKRNSEPAKASEPLIATEMVSSSLAERVSSWSRS